MAGPSRIYPCSINFIHTHNTFSSPLSLIDISIDITDISHLLHPTHAHLAIFRRSITWKSGNGPSPHTASSSWIGILQTWLQASSLSVFSSLLLNASSYPGDFNARRPLSFKCLTQSSGTLDSPFYLRCKPCLPPSASFRVNLSTEDLRSFSTAPISPPFIYPSWPCAS